MLVVLVLPPRLPLMTLTKEEVAAQSDEMRRMLGFQAHGPYLGVWPEDPDGLWYET